jgi:hypothetical protein
VEAAAGWRIPIVIGSGVRLAYGSAQFWLRRRCPADGFDTAVSLLERRDRGRTDRMVAGGVGLNVTGLACWTTAVALLRRAPAG